MQSNMVKIKVLLMSFTAFLNLYKPNKYVRILVSVFTHFILLEQLKYDIYLLCFVIFVHLLSISGRGAVKQLLKIFNMLDQKKKKSTLLALAIIKCSPQNITKHKRSAQLIQLKKYKMPY